MQPRPYADYDPGQTTNDTLSLSRMGQTPLQTAGNPYAAFGEDVDPNDWQTSAMLAAKRLPYQIARDYMERPALDTFAKDILPFFIAPPERGAMSGSQIIAPALEKLGAGKQALSSFAKEFYEAAPEVLGNEAGMIRWGAGKEYPNAMLHRAIGDPKELDWWSRLFQRGESSQKPTSVVTPSVLQTFQSEPYGLLFNVNEPGQIKHAAPWDMYSEPRGIGKITNEGVIPKQEWSPTVPWMRWEEETRPTLPDLLESQLRQVKQIKANQGGAGSHLLSHSEVIPEADRSMLAGVRLPMDPFKTEPGLVLSLEEFANDPLEKAFLEANKDFREYSYNQDLIRNLTNFAEQQNVPIYRWPAVQTIDQEIKGLSGDPLRGKWGWKPGTREYITSSRLPEIFGITELP